MSVMPDEKPESRVLRHIFGMFLFPVSGVAVALVWLIVVTKIMSFGQEGFGLSGVLIVLPVYAIAFGVAIWLPIWLVHDRKFGEMSPRRAVLIGLVAGFILAVLLTGLNSFGPAPGAQYFGWAILAVMAMGAWAHNKVLNR